MEYQVHNDVLPILLCNTNSVRLLNQNTSKSGVGHCGSIALGEIGQLVMGSVIDLVRRTVFVSSHPSDQLSQGSRIAFASVISVYIWPKSDISSTVVRLHVYCISELC